VPTDNVFSTCDSYSEELKVRVTPKRGIGGRHRGRSRSMAVHVIYLGTAWGGWLTHALSQGHTQQLQQTTAVYSVTYFKWET